MKKVVLIVAALAALGLTAAAQYPPQCHTQMYCDAYGCRPIVICR